MQDTFIMHESLGSLRCWYACFLSLMMTGEFCLSYAVLKKAGDCGSFSTVGVTTNCGAHHSLTMGGSYGGGGPGLLESSLLFQVERTTVGPWCLPQFVVISLSNYSHPN